MVYIIYLIAKMKGLKKVFILFALLSVPMFFLARPIIAQGTDSVLWTDETNNVLDLETSRDLGIITALFTGSILIFIILLGFAQYIYSALTLQKTAQRLGMKNTWFAWFPILNAILLFKMGDLNPYLLFLLLIPIVGALILSILSLIALMNICEKREYDKVYALFILIPLAGLVLWGLLAWGKEREKKAIA